MLTGDLDGKAASDLELGKDAIARLDGEAVDESLGDGFANVSRSAEGDFL